MSQSGDSKLDERYKTLQNKLQVIDNKITKARIHFSRDYISHLDSNFYEEVKPILTDIYELEKEKHIYLKVLKDTDFSTDRKIFPFIKALYKNETDRFTIHYDEFHRRNSTKLTARNTSPF